MDTCEENETHFDLRTWRKKATIMKSEKKKKKKNYLSIIVMPQLEIHVLL